MSALICGSLAYDTIMVFSGRFKNEILPDKVHILNVAFLVPELRKEFGRHRRQHRLQPEMLGGEPLPMATVGRDFAQYEAWLDQHGISRPTSRPFPRPTPRRPTSPPISTTTRSPRSIRAR